MFKPNLALGKEIVEAAAKNEGFGGTRKKNEWFQIKAPGLHRLRILPPFSANGDFGKTVFNFFDMPTIDPMKPTSLVCVEKTFPERGMKCPIMEVIRELEHLSEGGKKFAFNAWDLRPDERYYLNVLVRQTTNKVATDPNTIYIGNFPRGVKQWTWEKMLDPDWGDITDAFTGRDVKFTRKDENGRTNYDREVVPSTSPILPGLDKDQMEQFLSELPNLNEVFSYPNDEMWGKINESAALWRESLLRKFNLIGGAFTGGQLQQPQQFGQQYVAPAPQQSYQPTPAAQFVQPAPQPQVQSNYVAPVVQVVPQTIAPVGAGTSIPTQPPIEVTTPIVTPEPVVYQQPTAVVIPVINTPPVTPAAKKKSADVPVGAPDCYGDKNVQSETNEMCNICIFEFECKHKIVSEAA